MNTSDSWKDLNQRQRFSYIVDAIESLQEPTLDNIRKKLIEQFPDFKLGWLSPALKRLTTAKLIDFDMDMATGGPDRKVKFYRIIGSRQALFV